MATETWLLNDRFDFKNTQWTTLSASFTSNGQSFSSIKYSYADFDCHYINYDNTSVYDDDGHIGWSDEAYRTIVLDTPAAGDLLTWLQANAVKQVTPRVSVDLTTAFPDKWAGLTIGKHTLQIRAKNPGNYLDSDLSTAIDFYKTVPITVTATNCTAAASNPTEFPDVGGGDTILTFNKKTGYTLPETIVITGVAAQNIGYSWTVASDGQSAQLKILKALGDIEVTVTGVAETYNITVKGTNARQASGPSTIAYGGSATLTFAYDDGYFAPTSIKDVAGATGSWNQSTSTLNLTNCTGPVTVTIEGAVKTYSITPALTNCTWDAENATTIASNQFTPIQLRIHKNTGWTLPTEIQVSGVNAKYWSWNQSTGIVTISHPQGNVTVTASAVREVYNITTNLTHAVAGSGNPTTIGYGLNATLTFIFPTGYEAPDKIAITVTGADFSWEKGTGTMVLMNAQGAVNIELAGVASTTKLDGGTYKWRDNAALTGWTQEINFTSNSASYSGMRYTGNGTAMTLQYMNADSEWQTVYNYDEDTSTGSWVNTAWQIVDLGTSAQTVTAIFKADFVANTTKLTQLATPQNVSANGTTVSWDEVENATSYAVLADGSEIGTVEKAAARFVQIFPTKTSDNYTLIENLNQSKIYSIQSKNTYDTYNIFYLKYENGKWTLSGENTGDISLYIRSQTDNSVKLVLQDGVAFKTYSSGITLEGDSEATESDFNGLSPTQVYACWVCFVEGTKITLSDGSAKSVQDIQYGDKVLCYDFTNGVQTTSYIDWMIPERIATKYWEITLSDGTILNLVGSNGKSHRLYNITKQRFDYPQDFETSDLTLKEDGTTAYVLSCREIEKEVKFYNIASNEHINVYANGVLTSNRLNNRFKIVDNKFTDEKVMTDKEVIDYLDYLNAIKAV